MTDMTPPPARAGRRVALGVGAGLVVGALLAGGATWAAMRGDSGAGETSSAGASPAAEPSRAKISLPDRIDADLVALDTPARTPNAKARADFAASRRYAVAQLADVGLTGDQRGYAPKGLTYFVTVQAFRGPGGPYVPGGLTDPAQIGTTHAPMELVRSATGDTCIETWNPGDTGDTPENTTCQRTDGALTVRAGWPKSTPDQVSRVIGEIWPQLH